MVDLYTSIEKNSIHFRYANGLASCKMNSTVLSDGLLQDGGYVLQTENSTTKSIFSEWLPARCGFQIALSVAYGLVFVIGFIGNVLVIVAVVRGGHKMMRHSVTNIFLVNLAVSDLLVILFYAPINFTLNRKLFTTF